MEREDEKIRLYFLGSLPEAEAEEIEMRLIADAEFEANVIAAESELIEDRLDSVLKPDEMRLFDENYLITTERRKNVEAVVLLRKYARTRAQKIAQQESAHTEVVSILDRIRGLLGSVPTIAYAACLILIIGGTAAYVWLGRNSAKNPLQSEYASLNQQDFSDLAKFNSLPLIPAVPGSVRGPGSAVKLKGSENSAFVRIALVEFRDETALNAVLSRAGGDLLSFEALKIYESNGNREVRMLLPARLLEKGTYQISVSAPGKPASTVVYSFTIE